MNVLARVFATSRRRGVVDVLARPARVSSSTGSQRWAYGSGYDGGYDPEDEPL